MKNLILISCLIFFAHNTFAYPSVYSCSAVLNGKPSNIVLTVLSKELIALDYGGGMKPTTWTATPYQDNGPNVVFNYLNNDIYMTVSKSMMIKEGNAGSFLRDSAYPTYSCKKTK